jgi:elongation factor G
MMSEQTYLNVPRMNEGGGNEINIEDNIKNQLPPDTLISNDYIESLSKGIHGALSRGPHYTLPVTNLCVKVTDLNLIANVSTPASLRAAAYKATQELLKQATPVLLEPIMDLSLRVPDRYVGNVTKDVSGSLKGYILSMDSENDENADSLGSEYKDVEARAPLRYLVGYSSHLRAITKGAGQMSMNMNGYGCVSKDQVEAVVKELRGF